MPIQFIGGTSNASAGVSVTSLVLTYAPTAGHFVVVDGYYQTTGAPSWTCNDNNGNSLSAGPNVGSNKLQMFYGTAIAGATSYTLSLSTARVAMGNIVEYSGVVGVGATATASASSASPALTVTATHASALMATAVGINQTLTATAIVGTILEQLASSPNTGVAMDNSTGGTMVCSLTISASHAWDAGAMELYPTQAITQYFNNQLMMTGCGT